MLDIISERGEFVKFVGVNPLENRPSRLAPPGPIPAAKLVTTQGLTWARDNGGFDLMVLIVPNRHRFFSVEDDLVSVGQLIGVVCGPLVHI